MIDFRHIPLGDDFAFSEVMREPEICRHFLETVLGIRICRLEFAERELDLTDSFFFHGIRLDVYVEDDENSVYNIEMQNRLESYKRIRYYQAGIDRRTLTKGSWDYRDLKTSYIITVCSYDPTGNGADLKYPMYRRESVLTCPAGTDGYDDGSHVIFLNARYDPQYREAMPEVCEFLDQLSKSEDVPAESLEYPLARMAVSGLDRLRKDDAKGVFYMTIGEKIKEEAWYAKQEGLKEGLEQGREKGREDGIAIGEERGFTLAVEKLMKKQGLTREEAKKLLS